MSRLPYSEDAEQALLARLILDPAQVPMIAATLSPADLHVADYRKAYQAMCELSRAGRTVDVETVKAACSVSVDIRTVTRGHKAPLDEYVAIIRRHAMRRRVIEELEGVVDRAYSEDDEQSILSELHDAVSNITRNVEQGALVSPQQAAEGYHHTMTRRASGMGLGLPYGIVPLDALLHPAQGGEMIVVAARPSIGKTTFAEHIVAAWSERGPVLFCSLEMSVTQLMDRAVARRSRIVAQHVIRSEMSEEEAQLAHDAVDQLGGQQVWYLDDGRATTASVRAAAARTRLLAGGLVGIVVDYMQILKDAGDSDNQRVGRISRDLKAIAREYDVPLLALSQLNRQSENREDRRPRLADLRDSGAIEQDADVVIGLHRTRLDSPDLDVLVLKARQGHTGEVRLYFETEYVALSAAS